MTADRFHPGDSVVLKLAVAAFGTAEEARRVDWRRRIILSPGRYTIVQRGINNALRTDEHYSDGCFYELVGPNGHGWVRQNYILAGSCADWPWDLTMALEPVDWTQAFVSYLRLRVEGSGACRDLLRPAGFELAAGRGNRGGRRPGTPVALPDGASGTANGRSPLEGAATGARWPVEMLAATVGSGQERCA